MNPTIKEVIVVEGRDDTAAIKRAVNANIIETHGYGISKKTWQEIERAYREYGIIVFTDPDYAGNLIRKRIIESFPDAKEAYLSRPDAEKSGDIGVENASPSAIIMALEKAKCTRLEKKENIFSKKDLVDAGLTGGEGALKRREALGRVLGIGSGNSRAFLNKLNGFGITKEEYYEALRTIDNK